MLGSCSRREDSTLNGVPEGILQTKPAQGNHGELGRHALRLRSRQPACACAV